ncbi:XdhC family protein [Streptomyces cyaneofuscatus]|uniref:XdhC family protein n=1 Tax=Streptomyces cyaneofuscatus TaxID=66883 RepID=UPI0036687C78
MGSCRTREERLRLLQEAGVEGQSLAALCFAIGLGLRARTSEETADSITSEIIASQRGQRPAAVAAHRPHSPPSCSRASSHRKDIDRMTPHHVR